MMPLIIYIIISILFFIQGCEKSLPVTPSTTVVKIGFIGTRAGLDVADGEDTLEGVLAAQALRPTLPNGDRVEVVTEDGGDGPEVTKAALSKLVNEIGVAALLVGVDSDKLLQVAEYAESLHTPIIALIATHPGVVSDSVYISQLCFDDATQGSVAALFVRDELLIKRAAVFTTANNQYSAYLGEFFQKRFIATGGELTGSHDVADISEALLQELQNKNTEILYLPIASQYLLKIMSLLEAIEWSPKIMTSDGLLASVMKKYPEKLDYLEGVFATELFSDSGEFIRYKSLGKQANYYFGERHYSDISTLNGLGIEGYAIVVNAIAKCQPSVEPDCVNNKIRSTNNFEGIMSKISIDEQGKAIRPVYVNTIEDGHLKSVVKVY